jgi:hypothetical protein
MFLASSGHCITLVEDPLIECFVTIVVDANLIQYGLKILNDLRGCLEPCNELCDEVFGLFCDLLLVFYVLELATLDLLLPTYDIDVVD